jgi:mannosyl-3-phosphoglycerate phosphatase
LTRTRFAIFTDLDGTLLDEETFDVGPARTTLARLADAGAPVIPVTSRTLEEVEPLANELGFQHALIVEAGSAIARMTPIGWELETCGPDADQMLDVVRKIELATGAHLNLYSVMKRDEAAQLSGLSVDAVPPSQRRMCDEPFVISKGKLRDVINAASSLGFSVRHDGRLFHLCGATSIASAISRVRQELRCATMVAVGSAPIDSEFLALSDIAVIVPRADGLPDAELLSRVPHARVAPQPGPAGWAAAIDAILIDLQPPVRPTRHFAASDERRGLRA